MAEIRVVGTNVIIEMQGWERVWSLRRSFTIPLEQVKTVGSGNERGLWPHGIRLPGAYLPGVIAAGTYRGAKAGNEFWSVYRGNKSIELTTWDFSPRIFVVQVDPARKDQLIHEIRAAAPRLDTTASD